MSKIFKCFSVKEWIIFVVILGFLGLNAYCNLTLPEFMGAIIGDLQKGAMIGNLNLFWNDILKNGGLMLLLVTGAFLSTFIVSYLSAYIFTSVMAKVRRLVFEKVNDFSMNEINKFSIASLITRSTNDITQLQIVMIMVTNMGLTAPIMAIVAIIKIVNLSYDLSIVTALSIVALLLLILIMFIFVVPKFKKVQTLTDKVNLVTRENLTGIKVVRANSAEKIQEEKFKEVNTKLTKTNIFINRVAGIMNPGITLIMSGTSLALVWLGAYLISNGSVGFETLTEFTQYAMQIILAFMMVSLLLILVPRGMVSAQRIKEIIKSESSIKDGEGIFSTEEQGTVEFKNVSFKYPGADDYVLRNISFKAEKGQTIAFIGSTGSGKSTLINLIPRFYDCTEGEVLLDNVNVKNYKLNDLHDKIGYVPQKGVLFSGTVEENIKYGNENASEEDIENAIKISQAKFVYENPEGLSSRISQGGHNVSGGQKQRLCIARAIVRKPEILIFDDSFSALDYKTDKTLRQALKKHIKGTTCLIVAQRIGTIRNADQIIVLDEGNMVGIGTHEQLLKKCKVYKEIALSQLKKEEL